MNEQKHVVILANLGAPTNLDEVQPFLKNLFQDRDIFQFPFGEIGQKFFSSLLAALRAPKSRTYYSAIGGGSPLHKNTVAQAAKLQKILDSCGDFTVFVAQRYWHPFFREVASEIRDDNFNSITVLPLYPHYSTTTTLSIINEWNNCASGLPEANFINRFYDDDDYLNACVKQIRVKLDAFDTTPHILFSAHSIPIKRVLDGDPYEDEIKENVEMIIDRLGRDYSYSLCYQSKVGPIKWLAPTVEEKIDELVAKGIKRLLVFPVSFVSEHVETLYELDIRKREYALSKGIIQYERVNTVQDSDEFIQMLKKLVLEVLN